MRLMLVHGFGGSHEDFTDWLPAFEGIEVEAVAVSLPRSEGSFAGLASFVLASADRLGWDRFVLFGHSMGGMVAQLVALRAPERLAGLVLMGTTHGPIPADLDVVELGKAVVRGGGMAALVEAQRGRPGTAAHERLLRERPGYRAFMEAKALAMDPAAWVAFGRRDGRAGRPAGRAAIACASHAGRGRGAGRVRGRLSAHRGGGAGRAVGRGPRRRPLAAVRGAGSVVVGGVCVSSIPAIGGRVMDGNGGDLALAALAQYGVRELFTLNGAHIWPLYDAARRCDVRLVDTRHEQTAAFAAEGMAKLTRRPGVAALTAGPGVTNGVSPVASAQSTGAPLIVLGGRAAANKWGPGSLQEFDHVPLMTPITKFAATAPTTESIASVVGSAAAAAMTPHRGPAFVDIGIDVIFGHAADVAVPPAVSGGGAEVDDSEVAKAAALLAGADRPVLVCGTDVWFNGAESALRRAVESLRVPVFMNGMGRGVCPPTMSWHSPGRAAS